MDTYAHRNFRLGTRSCLPAGLMLLAAMSAGCSQMATGMAAPVNRQACETVEQKAERMKWWTDARFGLFIHWGPVSLEGTEIGWSRGNPVPVEKYDNLYQQFNPTEFDAARWISLAKQAGMKYVVLVTKHHDGFNMFDTKYSDYGIMQGPFKRDVTRELADECRRQGIRFCTYYSVADWHHPDYLPRGQGDTRPVEGADFERYFTYMKDQLRELVAKYQTNLVWFDGHWEDHWTTARGREIYALLRELSPGIIINDRLSGRDTGFKEVVGDYATPEQTVGKMSANRDSYWESCMTICQQWSWKPEDKFKSLKECIHLLVKNAGMDGNFLLNISPMPNGQIEPRQAQRLQEIGKWLEQYGQSIYGTRGGPFRPIAWGVSTCKDDAIYLHVLEWPAGGAVNLPPITRKVVGCTLLTGGQAECRQDDDGIKIRLPDSAKQEIDTIVALKLDGSAVELPLVYTSGSVAVGRPAKASSVYNNDDTYDADKAVDDDLATRWACKDGVKQASLEIDLGKQRTICSVLIDEPQKYQRIKGFELQYQSRGKWKTALKGTTIGPNFRQDIGPIKTARIRLNITDAADGPTINELQVFPRKRNQAEQSKKPKSATQ